jgi:hypothetical protein
METIEIQAPVKNCFRVLVQSLDSQRMEYNLRRGTTIEQVKQQISRNISIPVNKIRLVFAAKPLEDSQKIEEIVSEDDQVFHLIARLNIPEIPAPHGLHISAPQPPPQNPQTQILNFDLQSFFRNINSLLVNPNSPGSTPLNNNGNPPPQQNTTGLGSGILTEGNPTSFVPLTTSPNVNPTNVETSQGPRPPNGQQNAPNVELVNAFDNIRSMFETMLGNVNTGRQTQTNSQTGNNIEGQQPQNVESQSSQRNQSDLTSANSEGITISLSTSSGTVQRLLDTRSLKAIGTLVSNSSSIGFDIPRPSETDNSATMTGDYLRTLHDHLQKFLPELLRCSDILRGEQRLREEQQRAQASRLVRNMGGSIGHLRKSLTDLEFLTNFDFKDQPSNFGLDNGGDGASIAGARIPLAPSFLETQSPGLSQLHRDSNRDDSSIREEVSQVGRQSQQNSLNNQARVVPLIPTLREINQRIGERAPLYDICSVVFENLSYPEYLQVLLGNVESLNTRHKGIRADFQNHLIRNQNNDNQIKKEMLGAITSEFAEFIHRKGPGIVFEGLDIELIMNEINEEYYHIFKEIFLDDYASEVQLEPFSVKYTQTLKLYVGRLAYELSEGMQNGVANFRRLLTEFIADYVTRDSNIPTQARGIDILFWKHVYEGYLIQKQKYERAQEERRLSTSLGETVKVDKEGPPEGDLNEDNKSGSSPNN